MMRVLASGALTHGTMLYVLVDVMTVLSDVVDGAVQYHVSNQRLTRRAQS